MDGGVLLCFGIMKREGADKDVSLVSYFSEKYRSKLIYLDYFLRVALLFYIPIYIYD
ncbi:hypothetical protein JCM21714_4152 [Gracilibacillus boraciitolerans JCM 21714]|uniref:Uncharacterized protein n=1 Tax=Gracilibacillus boraciitolerans JCM 21714 TaxID=1298598 RepID=W4VP68_9BACI|nr:hypothetical protein JCM21714_4152 [Gracilibacillus boraciitolerans JCM 21714]